MSIFALYAAKEKIEALDNMSNRNMDFIHEIRNLADTGKKMLDAYILAGERIKEDWEKYNSENMEKV